MADDKDNDNGRVLSSEWVVSERLRSEGWAKERVGASQTETLIWMNEQGIVQFSELRRGVIKDRNFFSSRYKKA
jgi:hypothetical protein